MITKLQHRSSLVLVVLVLSILFGASGAFAQTTSFTYQGRLTDGGTPANGNYDLQFALFDNVSGGAQVVTPLTLNTVAVSNGVFTVSLDFGASAFTGASRFLEISARPAGSGSFTPLTPRQPITSTPYAVRSLNAATADSVPASGVPAGSGNYIQNSASAQASSNFNISGNGTAGGMLSGNVVNATTQYNLNGSRILSNPGQENLFAGAGAGTVNTTGAQNTLVGDSAGASNTTGNANAFFGKSAGALTTMGSGNAFFGVGAGVLNTTGIGNVILGDNAEVGAGDLTNATAIGFLARVDASNSLVLGSIANVNGATADTKVGIGTTAPKQKLHVKGQGLFTADAATFDPGDGVGPAIRIGFDSAGGYGYINANNTGVTAKNLVLQPNSSQGNVGIGTTSPLRLLHVNGRARIGTIPLEASNGSVCFLGSTGDLVQCGASSLKWKTNVQPFRSGLDIIQRLRPISFNWKQDGLADIGLGAEDVAKVAPSLTFTDDKGEVTGVKYERLSMLLINAIKEQQAQIQQQRELIERQQALAERQQRQLNALKKLACRSHRGAGVCK
jgi:hypothetical protein